MIAYLISDKVAYRNGQAVVEYGLVGEHMQYAWWGLALLAT